MWLLTNLGFFSVVETPEDSGQGTLTVRARVRSDLEALRERYLPELTDISTDQGTDYRYRARVPRGALSAAVGKIVADIHYPNFKDCVADKQGEERANVYSDVWRALTRLQKETKGTIGVSIRTSKRGACGGVLIDSEGRVLLREPTRHSGGCMWTLPRGTRDEGESEMDAVARIVHEQTGYRAQIVRRIEPSASGVSGEDSYFVLRPVGTPVPFHLDQTQALRWATFEEAKQLLGETTDPDERKRDLAVLAASANA